MHANSARSPSFRLLLSAAAVREQSCFGSATAASALQKSIMENKMESKEEVQRRRLLQEEDHSSSKATRWVTATAVKIELEVLDCPICYRPLKPPVFQCAVGHVICSGCRGKLAGIRSCHTCGGATDFSRCFAVEHIVESVRVPCANAARGCAAKAPYHGKEEHEETCPHAHAELKAPAATDTPEVKAVTTGPAAPDDTPDVPVPEQGGNIGSSRGRNLVAGLVFASICMIPVAIAIPVVRDIILHFTLQGACSRVASVAT